MTEKAKEENLRNLWDGIFQRNEQNSVWPWSDLVGTVLRNTKPATSDYKVLELGCGAGANIPFFLSLGVDYYSVDVSEIVVSRLQKKFPQLEHKLFAGDFSEWLPSGEFDLIFDRGALTCNKTSAIQNCLQLCHDQLKPDGKYIGIDWFSTKHSAFFQGEVEDDWVRVNFPKGSYVEIFRMHFSNKEHLIDLFRNFEFQELRHKTIESELDFENPIFAGWNFAALKK